MNAQEVETYPLVRRVGLTDDELRVWLTDERSPFLWHGFLVSRAQRWRSCENMKSLVTAKVSTGRSLTRI